MLGTRLDPAIAEDVRVERCRDPEVLERILVDDFYEEPIRYFPASLKRAVARGFFATSENIVFLTAQVDGERAGVVFGHTLGQTLWRKFARANCHRFGLVLAWVVFQQRVLKPRGIAS